ncbi:MAG: DHHA2 domain-containing protein, partial [Clostridium sp.]
EIDRKTAGLLCSAIISDTLLFRSPTCTPVDRAAAEAVAKIAQINLEELASQMFAAGSKLKGKSDAEIFYQDFKRFSAGKISFGVGQITSLNADELEKLKKRMLSYMEKARAEEQVDVMFFMLTNILTESTDLLCVGQGAVQMVSEAFHVEAADEKTPVIALPGVVSRKKQLVPGLMVALEQ